MHSDQYIQIQSVVCDPKHFLGLLSSASYVHSARPSIHQLAPPSMTCARLICLTCSLNSERDTCLFELPGRFSVLKVISSNKQRTARASFGKLEAQIILYEKVGKLSFFRLHSTSYTQNTRTLTPMNTRTQILPL